MKDLILYRNEWYEVNKYLDDGIMLKDEIGNIFHIFNKDIQIPSINLIACYA